MLVEAFERVYPYEENTREVQQVRSKCSIFASDNKVSIVESNHFTGRRRDSGKRWFRWTTQRATGFYRYPNGTIAPYDYIRRKGNHLHKAGMHNTVPTWAFAAAGAYSSDDRYHVYADQFNKTFGDLSLKSLYPISDMYGIEKYETIPFNFIRDFREEDFKVFVARAFDKKNVRKDLVKAVAKANPYQVAYVSRFKNQVPVDWIVNYLRNHEEDRTPYANINRYAFEQIPGILRHADPRTKRNLLNDTAGFNIIVHLINDTFPSDPARRQYVQPWNATGNVYRSWSEIHDAVYQRPARIRFNYDNDDNRIAWTPPPPPKNEPVKLNALALSIEGMVLGDMVISCAKDTDTMRSWSDEMGNCIRSYTSYAQDGRNVYAGVYKAGKLFANLEIQGGGKMSQMLGKYNKNLDEEVRERLECGLRMLAGIDVSQYWGKPEPVVEYTFHGDFDAPGINIGNNNVVINNGGMQINAVNANNIVYHYPPLQERLVDLDADW